MLNPNTESELESGYLKNETDKPNGNVSIYSHYFNVWATKLFDGLQETLLEKQRKRPHSTRRRRCPRMKLMNLYANKQLQKRNHLHASLDDGNYRYNLPDVVRGEIMSLISNVVQKGYIFRRVPSVDLLPVDREKVKKKEVKLEGVYKKVT